MNPEEMELRGHRMSLAEANIPFAICLKCGAWMARRVFARLRKACEAPTVNGRQALDRLRRGLPPWAASGRTANLGDSATVVGRWTKEHGWIAATPQLPTQSDDDRGDAVTASAEEARSDRPGGEPQRARDEGTAAQKRLEAVRGRVRDREAARQAQDATAWRLTHYCGGEERARPGGQPGAEDVSAGAAPRGDHGEREEAAPKRATTATDRDADDRGATRRRIEESVAQIDRPLTPLGATPCRQRGGGGGADPPSEKGTAKRRRMGSGGAAEAATSATGDEERRTTESEPQHAKEEAANRQPDDGSRSTDLPASLVKPRPQCAPEEDPGNRNAQGRLGTERPVRRRRLTRDGDYADAGSATSDTADQGSGTAKSEAADRRGTPPSVHDHGMTGDADGGSTGEPRTTSSGLAKTADEESGQRKGGDMPQSVSKRRRLRWRQPPARAPEDTATSTIEMVSGP
jgi:hypothetical protein